MIVLYWNIRGINNGKSQEALKNHCSNHKPDYLFLSEPLVDFHKIPSYFWASIGMQLVTTNSRPNKIPSLWIFKSLNSLSVSIISISCQHVTFTTQQNNNPITISAIYAHNDHRNRRIMWEELTSIRNNSHLPWLVIGDFNCILGAHEKRGGKPHRATSCVEF